MSFYVQTLTVSSAVRPTTGKRRSQWAISRIMGNIGVAPCETKIGYADTPIADDDPYRYYLFTAHAHM